MVWISDGEGEAGNVSTYLDVNIFPWSNYHSIYRNRRRSSQDRSRRTTRQPPCLKSMTIKFGLTDWHAPM